ncbi:winged helix DNA-binding domain-containing protein [Streptomyces sp. BI20]|uniref:winged helix DNA-binding domain-containing protein n=1 Tax=Streptomyces sp. BI20 TaxID=3403460 RepID=UPI003C78BD0A
MAPSAVPVLDARALGRATLARQLLLERAERPAAETVELLLGLQAQNTAPPYFQLHARLAGFDPAELAGLMEERRVVRIVTLRSTIHTHTVRDAARVRSLVQPARTRELHTFRAGLAGVDLDLLAGRAREFVTAEPRTMAELRTELSRSWPAADPASLAVAARCLLPLVQTTPRGVWGRSGQVRLTTLERWTGLPERTPDGTDDPRDPAVGDAALDALVLRYLRAFGPASVRDAQTWCGLTRLRAVFDRLAPDLLRFRDEAGVELYDVPEGPRPDPATPAPVRFLPEFDNLLLSHADRTRVIPAAHKGRNAHGNQSLRVWLADGSMAGVWRFDADARAGRTTLVVTPFAPVTRVVRAEIEEEGGRLLREMSEHGRVGGGVEIRLEDPEG